MDEEKTNLQCHSFNVTFRIIHILFCTENKLITHWNTAREGPIALCVYAEKHLCQWVGGLGEGQREFDGNRGLKASDLQNWCKKLTAIILYINLLSIFALSFSSLFTFQCNLLIIYICVNWTIIQLICCLFQPFLDAMKHLQHPPLPDTMNWKMTTINRGHTFREPPLPAPSKLFELVRARLWSVYAAEEVLGKLASVGARQLAPIFCCVTFPESSAGRENSHNKYVVCPNINRKFARRGGASQNKSPICSNLWWVCNLCQTSFSCQKQ